jgi:enoyl-CoA hydratase/carnithine racemase
MAERVLRRVEEGVGVVSLNRPEKHNAVDDAMGPALREALDWAFESPDVRCVLLRGEGPSFCSGRDTTVLGHRANDESDYAFVRRAQDGRLAMLDVPKPIVAALRGHVIGGGMEMALAADMRIAATDVRMRLPEVHYGILPDTGGTQVLTTLIGPSRTKYLVMTGDVVDGEQALAWGIVDWLVAPEALDDEALTLAKKLAAGPPLAVAMAKQLVDQVWGESLRRGIRAELLAQTTLFRSDDYHEARAALREKRPPKYKGK